MDQEQEKPASFSQIIKHKGFANLWFNQILVQLSYNSLNFALLVWVFRLTDSSTAVAWILVAVYLPAVLVGPFAGILVDIVDRKKMIRYIDFFLAITFLAFLFFKGDYLAIVFLSFMVNVFAQFYIPAESSAIPLIVSKRELLSANSLFSTTLFGSFLVGFGLAGPVINHLGIDFIFAAGAFLQFIAFCLTFTFPSIVSRDNPQSVQLKNALKKADFLLFKQISFTEFTKTISLVRGRLTIIVPLFILAFVQVGIGILGALIPSFFEKTLQVNSTDASYVLVLPLGIGMVLGGILMGKFGYKFPKRKIVGSAILLVGLLFFAVGIAPIVAPAIKYFPKPRPLPFFYQIHLSTILAIGSFLLGLAMVSIVVPSQTVLQENTPEELRGKVFAILGVLMSGLTLIPVLLVGVLADFFGTAPIFIAIGGAVAILGFMALKPDFYFDREHLPFRLRQFLGLGHWQK